MNRTDLGALSESLREMHESSALQSEALARAQKSSALQSETLDHAPEASALQSQPFDIAHEASGHDFSRAKNRPPNDTRATQESSALESEALARAQKSSALQSETLAHVHKASALESQPFDIAHEASGHDFSRAKKRPPNDTRATQESSALESEPLAHVPEASALQSETLAHVHKASALQSQPFDIGHEASGHDFSRAKKRPPNDTRAAQESSALESEALARAQKSSALQSETLAHVHKASALQSQPFDIGHEASGHDFSRAKKRPQNDPGFSPCAPVNRRDFLKLLGSGILVCLTPTPSFAQESGRTNRHELPTDISAWLHIDADGRVKVFTGKVEVGQNIRTSLAQAVAEELRVPFDSITMIMGDTDLVPWDMGTFGSRTTPTMAPQLRNMAVAGRELLVEMAAQRWNADPSKLIVDSGKITTPDQSKSVTYGELTRGENLVKSVAGDPPLTPATEWKIAGTPIPKASGRDFVTGKHQFPSDIVRPGMIFGAVLRPEGFNAKLDSIDTTAAEKIPGVKVIREGDFTGVVADDAFTAHRAAAAIHAKWNVPAQQGNQGLFEYLKSNPEGEPEKVNSGFDAQAYQAADVKLESQYTVEYIAHTPLEPRAAVAEWNNGKLTVWTGTQRPFGVHEELMRAFQLAPQQVRVIQPDMGSGYGGKHTGEAAIEAARLAKASAKPVKVVWTREEEFTWAYLRPAGLIEIKSGARRDGALVSWEYHNYNSGPAAIGTPYDVHNRLIQFHPAKSPLRQGSYRGLAATANHFARESHMDEMAHALNMDPLQFRLKNISDTGNPRLKAVLHAAADKFGWASSKSTPDRGFGIACGTDKGGYVATCAEVSVDSSKKIKIRRVVQAWECGAIVNPDGLRNQVQGAIVQAIGGALFERILFSNGRIENPLLSKYRVPRFSDTPEIEIILLDRKDLPSAGAGETGIVGLAPAVGNAIFAATGARLRHMPMTPDNNQVQT